MSLRHLTIHLSILLFLQNFCFTAFGSGFFSLHDSPGTIPILKDSNGFYVNANLGPSVSTGNSTAKMMLILISNQTVLASKCWNFSPYDCNSYQCSMYALYSEEEYLWFTSDNQLAKAFVSLDDSYWKLNNTARIATACGGNNQDIGIGRYGTIGMASSGSTRTNFLKDPLFSIWFDPSLDNGVLVFGNDTAKYASSAEIVNFPISQDWRINVNNGYFIIGEKSFSLKGYLAFDINADIPGFDTNTFTKIISYIQTYFSDGQVKCDSSDYKPVCTYTGSFSFPDFSISPNFNLPGIPISSDWIYQDNTTSSFTLNIKKINQYLDGTNYISPVYDGLIVLDAKTMSRLYLVFNGTSQTIHLYHASTSPGSSWDWLYILIFTLIGVILIGVLVYFMVKATMESEEEAEKPVYILNAESSMNSPSTHQPLHSNEKR